jgi:hypothetical protein
MLLRPTSFLFALVLAALLVSPVLATGLSESSRINSNSYQGQAIRVTTQAVSGVTKTSATLNGYLESLGPTDIEVNVWFEYILNDGTSTVPTKTGPTKMTAPGPFSASAAGLTSYTPYQFRAVAASPLLGGQVVKGAYLPFHTLVDKLPEPIAVSNCWADEVSPGTAVLHGYLSRMETYNEVRVWFEWGTSAGFGNKAGEQILHTPGPFSIKIAGLSPNIRYYFRSGAFPTVAGTVVYSTTGSLTTPGAGDLAVSTWAVTNITYTAAAITGYLESMGAFTSANVWFEWGTTAAYGQVTPMQTLNQTGIYTYILKGLAAGTTYHFRAKAIPASGGWVTTQSPDNQFTTKFLPGVAVSTEPAGGVTANSAVLSGFLTSFGSSGPVSALFEYGTDTTFGSKTAQQTLNTTGNFRFAVTGLSPATTYYFRATAFSNSDSAYGQYSTFHTASSAALSISTDVATKVGPSSATLYAYINSLGSAPAIKVWFNFGQSPEYGINTPVQTFTSAGTVSAQVSGLTAETTYYFQAVAQAPDGNKVYGSQATFSTISMPKTAVTTYPATNVTNLSATLNGNLDNLGNTTSVQAWFEYGTTAEFGNATIIKTFDSPAPFSGTIPVLPGTTYYYRAVALNPVTGGGSVSGTSISFVTATLPSPPVTSPITSPYDWLIYCQRFVGSTYDQWKLSFMKLFP